MSSIGAPLVVGAEMAYERLNVIIVTQTPFAMRDGCVMVHATGRPIGCYVPELWNILIG